MQQKMYISFLSVFNKRCLHQLCSKVGSAYQIILTLLVKKAGLIALWQYKFSNIDECCIGMVHLLLQGSLTEYAEKI